MQKQVEEVEQQQAEVASQQVVQVLAKQAKLSEESKVQFREVLPKQEGIPGPVCVVTNILNESQVAQALKCLEEQGEFVPSSKSKHYRNTERSLMRSKETAEALWESVKPHFQQTIGKSDDFGHLDCRGTCRLCVYSTQNGS